MLFLLDKTFSRIWSSECSPTGRFTQKILFALKAFSQYCSSTSLYVFLKLLANDYSACQTQMKNGFKATNFVDQLSYILQTPEEVKGFSNFAVNVEGINVTDCASGRGSIATCQLLITNPLASFTIQVCYYKFKFE